MSRRQTNYPQMAPNSNLAMGAAVANGLQNAMKNYMQMRMQKSQMAFHQQQAQANAMYRQAQAENLARQNASADMGKVNLAFTTSQYLKQQGNPEAAKSVLSAAKPIMERAEANMSPAQVQQYEAHIRSQLDQKQVPSEFGDSLTLNPKEQSVMNNMNTGQTRENVANTYGQTRTDAAQIYADSRAQVAGINAKSKSNGGDQQYMKDLAKQMKQTSDQLSSLDKPLPMGATPLDDQSKQALRQKYQSDLAQQHQEYMSVHDRLSGVKSAPQTPQNAPGPAPAAPKVWGIDQASQAQPGDQIKDASGKAYSVGSQKHSDGTYVISPISAAPAPAAPAPQSAPPAGQAGVPSDQ